MTPMMYPPPLGFITPSQRSPHQHAAHAAAEARMPKFFMAGAGIADLAKGEAVRLFDAWSKPEVVADVGFVFPRFHQLTGSCVGAGGGQALFTLIAIQRMLADNPTKAFIPFWPFDYGRCRFNEGDRGQGEGAMGSSFADTVVKEGVIDATEQGLPAFSNSDGLTLASRSVEFQWSAGGTSLVSAWLPKGKVHPVGAAARLRNSQDIKTSIIGGYPVTFACDNFIGNGSIRGSGDAARVMGKWDGRGGHQQSIHAYEVHPDFGPNYLVLNNWPRGTYPIIPTQPVCSTWVLEKDVDYAAANFDAEIYGLSHLTWFEAQPSILDYFM